MLNPTFRSHMRQAVVQLNSYRVVHSEPRVLRCQALHLLTDPGLPAA